MLRGADISAWQGGVDIAAEAKRYGWDFVGIKATEGASSSDRYFSQNWARAKAAGLTRIAYHFARPGESSATSQADRLLFAAADAGPDDLLCLDLEASKLTQAQTNAWARDFGDRLRERAPGVTTVAYLGSGYASSNTGRGLADHFDRWWYPQYPSTKSTTTWPSSFSPWLPSGLTTGWDRPHIWQWTDNLAGKYDANVSPLTIDQLAGGGQPQEETDMAQRDLLPGLTQRSGLILIPKTGGYTVVEANVDNTLDDGAQVKPFAPVTLRVAVQKSGGTWQTADLVVGRGPKDTKQPRPQIKLTDKNSVFVSVTRVTGDGTEPITITAY